MTFKKRQNDHKKILGFRYDDGIKKLISNQEKTEKMRNTMCKRRVKLYGHLT